VLLTALGGTLLQLLVPVACWIAFATTSRNPFGAAVMAWWTGQNLIDISYYVNDARSLSIMLLGGHTGAEVEGHDWEKILGLTGLLARDHQIAWTAHDIGAVIMVGALAYGIYFTSSGDRRSAAVGAGGHESR